MVVHVRLQEDTVLRWVLQFLGDRGLYDTARRLEAEAGVCCDMYATPEIYFLRELVLNGDWRGVMCFIKPLMTPPPAAAAATANTDTTATTLKEQQQQNALSVLAFRVLTQQLLELLSYDPSLGKEALQRVEEEEEEEEDEAAKAVGAGHVWKEGKHKDAYSGQATLGALVACLRGLQARAPSVAAFKSLCLLLSLPRVQDHPDYNTWSVYSGRYEVLGALLPSVAAALGISANQLTRQTLAPDRLTTLLAHGAYHCHSSHADKRQVHAELVTRRRASGPRPIPSDSAVVRGTFSILGNGGATKNLEAKGGSALAKVTSTTAHATTSALYPTPPAAPNATTTTNDNATTITTTTDAVDVTGMGSSGGSNNSNNNNNNTEVEVGVFIESEALAPPPQISSEQTTTPPAQDVVQVLNERAQRGYSEGQTDFCRPEHPTTPSRSDYRRASISREVMAQDPDRGAALETLYRQHTAPIPRDVVPENLTAAIQRPPSQRRHSSSIAVVEEESDATTATTKTTTTSTSTSSTNTKTKTSKMATMTVEVNNNNAANSNINNNRAMTRASSSKADIVPPTSTTTTTTTAADAVTPCFREQRGGHVEGLVGAVAAAYLRDGQPVRTLSFHPSGDLVAVGSNSRTLRVCSSHLLREAPAPHVPAVELAVMAQRRRYHRGSLYCAAWSGDGKLIATGSNDKTVRMLRYDADTGAQADGIELHPHDGTVRDVTFGSRIRNGGELLLTGGGGDFALGVWDSSTGTEVGRHSGHSDYISSIVSHGSCVLTGSADASVRIWDVRAGESVHTFSWTGGDAVTSVDILGSGNDDGLLAVATNSGTCILLDLTSRGEVCRWRPHRGDCRSLRFSPDGRVLLSASYDGTVALCSVDSLAARAPQPASLIVASHADKCIQARWHPDGLAFGTTSADNTVRLWSLMTEEDAHEAEAAAAAAAAAAAII